MPPPQPPRPPSAGAMLSSGAASIYIKAFRRAGGGAAGRSAGIRAVSRIWPSATIPSIRAVADRADQSIQAGRRYQAGGPAYVLSPNDHGRVDLTQRGSGARGPSQYRYVAEVHWQVIAGGNVVDTGSFSVEVTSDAPSDREGIVSVAEALGDQLGSAMIITSPVDGRQPSFRILNVRIIAAIREVQ